MTKTVKVALNIPGMSTEGRGAPPSGFILIVEGPEATGKSRLAMTGPSGIAYFSLNIGSDRVIDEAREGGKVIAHSDHEYETPKFIQRKDRDYWEKRSTTIMQKHYEPFLDLWKRAYDADGVRTMVQDRADEFWEMAQRANFGKLQQNQQLAYGPVTDEFVNPIKMAKKAGKLVILIHEVKQAYERRIDKDGNEKSSEVKGKFVRGGCRHMAGIADAIIRCHYIPEGTVREKGDDPVEADVFETEIILSKHAMEWNRQRVETADIPTLMSLLKPKVDPSVWED